MRKKLGAVAASHESEYFVVAALQGYVEVWHEGARGSYEVDKLIGEEVRLYRRNAVAFDAVHPVEFAAEVEEIVFAPVAEVADVNACYHYFLSALGSGFSACSLICAIVPERERPRALGIVQ